MNKSNEQPDKTAVNANGEVSNAITKKAVEQPKPLHKPVTDRLINLYNHPDFEVVPGAPQNFILGTTTIDLAKLRPSQLDALKAHPKVAKFIRRK